jgi:DNA polymerase III subunit chi
MGVAMFYHLTRSGVAETLANLCGRALAQGWPVMIRGTTPDAMARLDDALWLTPEEGFLPHGLAGASAGAGAGAEGDSRQPVLIGQGPIANNARVLALIDAAEATPDEAAACDRLWVLFDGSDPAALDQARGLWKRMVDAGLAAQYWSEEAGRWQIKTERAATAG